MRARTLRPALAALRRDRRGVTVVEFGILAPVMGLLLLGGFDIAHTLYMEAQLDGIVQKAARDSALEAGGDQEFLNKLDAHVTTEVKKLAKTAQVSSSRRYYRTFSDAAAAKAESWTDTNNNGTCDAGEPYVDANLNGVWDADGGNEGQGGARDATIYTVTVKYPRLLPSYAVMNVPRDVILKASTVLRNQPFSDQGTYGVAQVRNCH